MNEIARSKLFWLLAPRAGLEPATCGLTVHALARKPLSITISVSTLVTFAYHLVTFWTRFSRILGVTSSESMLTLTYP